jgi:hypothetical protein
LSRPRLRDLSARRNGGAFLHDGDVVALHDVPDLVAEHARELRFAVEDLVESPGDQHVAAGRRERVDRRTVDHAEMPRQVRALGLRGDPAPDAVDIGLQPRIRDQRRGAEHAPGHFAPDRDFFLLVHAARGGGKVLARAQYPADVERRSRGQPGGRRERRGADRGSPGHPHGLPPR